jgi:hypothetical protein
LISSGYMILLFLLVRLQICLPTRNNNTSKNKKKGCQSNPFSYSVLI